MNGKQPTLNRRIPVRLSEKYWTGAQRAAEALEVTPSAIIRMALRDFLQRVSLDPEAPTNVQKPTVR